MAEFQSQMVNINRFTDWVAACLRWNCPSEASLAAFLDGTMEPVRKARVASHVTKCEYCCGVVVDVIKLQRSESPEVPAGLVQRAIAAGSTKSKRWGWMVAPVAATAVAAIAIAVGLIILTPENLLIPTPNAPAAPLIAKSEPPSVTKPGREAKTDGLRNSAVANDLPLLLLPERDKVVPRDHLKFEWKPVAKARYYTIHVVTPEGDLVWENESGSAGLALPRDVNLESGPYFVWISAYLDNGRELKSAPVRFLVSAPDN